MKRRKGFMAILILLLVAIGVSGYCYQSSRTRNTPWTSSWRASRDHDAQKRVQR